MIGKAGLTLRRWRLELVPSELTPSHRIQVWGLTIHPLVIFILPAIEVDPQEAVDDASHRGHTHQPRLHQIYSLQFHANVKPVVWDFLGKERRQASVIRHAQLDSLSTVMKQGFQST